LPFLKATQNTHLAVTLDPILWLAAWLHLGSAKLGPAPLGLVWLNLAPLGLARLAA